MFNTRNTPDMQNNEIFKFYYDKYANQVDNETFYLSGINYVYQCLDQLIIDAGFNDLCITDNALCSECCNRQEAHVSMAEMRLFVENNDFNYWLEKAMKHAQQDASLCEDLFFIDGNCEVYLSRFFICRAYMNLFNGEPYCPRHDTQVLIGQAVDDIVDCLYGFIDKLSDIDEDKYYGYITPTYFFIREYILQNHLDGNAFFKKHNLQDSWKTTYKQCRYAVGILGSVDYDHEYIESVKQVSFELDDI